MYSDWRNFDYWGDGSVILGNEYWDFNDGAVINEYTMSTPLKFSAGITLISKFGFISADIEMLNPGKSKYNSDIVGISFASENDAIRSSYNSVTNFRIGGELRHDMFRLRGGYGSFGNPYKNESIRFESNYWSAGAGIRTEAYFVDFALVSRSNKSYYFPYIFSDGEAYPVKIDSKTNTFVFTVGFTF
jgi:hypothetical protein